MKTLAKRWLGALAAAATLSSGTHAYALPVLNLNTPGAENVTVFPDSSDKNLYYLSPSVMLVAEQDGKPLFNYTEYGRWRHHEAIVQTTLAPRFQQDQIEMAKKRILQLNPNAQFTGIPFSSSKVVFGDILTPFIEASDCTHLGGVVGDEQNCSFRLSPFGVTVLRRQFQQNVAITLSLEYTVDGVAQAPNGGFVNRIGTYSVAGRIGGSELLKHPELFHDEWGNPIVIKSN